MTTPTLEDQIASDIANLSTSGFGGMVAITVTDGATISNLRGWWNETDATEELEARGSRRVRRATAWLRLTDLAAIGVDTTFALASEPTAIFERDVHPRRDPIGGLWVVTLVERTPLTVRVGRV
jgi:hypothetical protein